uniref:Uncharacterized protein n=1 Tax=Ciona savignyi TaxID=51511 RepID=H2YS70_CIOSA
MVQVAVSGRCEFEGSEADIIEGFVVNAVSLIGVLNELMDRESRIVRFDNGVRDLRGGDNTEGVHDSVWVLLADLANKERPH